MLKFLALLSMNAAIVYVIFAGVWRSWTWWRKDDDRWSAARRQLEVNEVEEVAACLGDDAAAMLDENPEDERALNMQRAAELLTAMQASDAEVRP